MSEVPFGPRIAGRPTQITGTPLDFDDRNHLLDLLRVELDPAIVAEFIKAVRRTRRLFRRRGGRRIGIVGVVERQSVSVALSSGLASALPSGLASAVLSEDLLSAGFRKACRGRPFSGSSCPPIFLVFVLVALFGRRLAQRHAVVDAEHDDDDIRIFGRENAFGCGGPVGRLALGLILDQSGGILALRITPMSGCST